MDWNMSGVNGAVSSQDSQQYLPQSTSSTIPTIQSKSVYVPQNACTQPRQLLPKDRFLKQLLNAKSPKEMLKLEQTAIANCYNRTVQMQQVSQLPTGQYNSYKPHHESISTSSNQIGLNGQNPAKSNFLMRPYANAVPQTPQQPQSMPVMQQYEMNGFNTREGQQPMQNSQASTGYVYPHQKVAQPVQNIYSIRHPGNAAQTPYQQVPKTNSLPMYAVQNGNSGVYVTSHKAPTEANIPVTTQDYRNSQNVQTAANYRTLPYVNTVQKPLLTVPQWNGNAAEYGQSPIRQLVQNFQSSFANNSMQQVTTSAGTPVMLLPPSYTQALINQSNNSNGPINPQFANQSQNYVVQNVQQPPQSVKGPQDPSTAAPPPLTHGGNVPQDRKTSPQELLVLLQIYRNVKQKYLLLNHENNLLRQKLQASNLSQEKASSCAKPTPLISTLPNALVPTNETVAGQQNVPQTAPVQSPPRSTDAYGFQAQNVYKNVVNISVQNNTQTSQSFPGNVCFTNQVSTSNVQDQNNYSVFDRGQMSTGNGVTSTTQAQSPESLRVNDYQKVASMVRTNASNQCVSSGNSSNGNVLQNEQTNPVTSESLNTACPPNTSNDFSSIYAAMLNGKSPFTPASREAIEAALPLWKSVPQNSSLSKNEPRETEHKQLFENSTVDAFNLLEETLTSTNTATSLISAQKLELTTPNASKCSEPLVARVYPLVQSREYQLSKVNVKSQDLENNGNNISMNLKEYECFGSAPLYNETSAKEGPQSQNCNPDSGAQPLLFSTEVSSQKEFEQNSTEDIDMADNDLQISGICTLVEGNSYYDSSIAMIFEDSKTEVRTALTKDTRNDHPLLHSEQTTSGTSEATNSNLPNIDPVTIKAEPSENEEGEFSLRSEENLHSADAQCFDQSLLSLSEAFCELEDSSVSDQLSELLTAFPFGIKNYMSENKLEDNVSPEKLADKPVTHKVSVPIKDSQSAFDSEVQNQDIQPTDMKMCMVEEEMQPERLPESTTDLQPTVERVPTPTKDIQLNLEQISTSPKEDGFDLVCNSPVNIQITLLDQAEIPKLFPDAVEQPLTQSCEETKAESCLEATCTEKSKDPVSDVELCPPKKEDSIVNEMTAVPDNLFCCLFSWLTHTNGNAPECDCKLTAFQKADRSSINSLHVGSQVFTAIKTESSENLPETSVSNVCKTVDSESKDHEILPLNNKPQKVHPVASSSESRPSLPTRRCSPQKETKLSFSENQAPQACWLSEESNEFLTRETSVPFSGEPTSKKKKKDNFPSKKTKSNRSPISEKLIVKTDFLKSKYLQKEKRKDKEMKTTQDAQGVSETRVHTQVFPQKSPGGELGQRSGVKIKHSLSITEHTDRSVNKPKSSSRSANSTAHTKHKRRYERVKNRPENHDETRKFATVPEFLERKREQLNKRSETKLKQRDEDKVARRTFDDKRSLGKGVYNPLPKRPLSPVKINVTSKGGKSEYEIFKSVNRTPKDKPRNGGLRESRLQSYRDSVNGHGKGAALNKREDLKRSSSKDKIYLSPCVGSSSPSYERLNLTKLQIRRSPEKRGYYERRKSHESSLHSKPPKSETKKTESPKMLEFKLCPEFVHRSPAAHEKSGEPKSTKEKSVVEGIKSKKEAWCNAVPFKKRKLESYEDQGCSAPSVSTGSSRSYKPIEKSTVRPVQDSRATFNIFKQMYHEQRSKSLDSTLGSL
ncbi:retroelement silencing factor 1 [Mixophyes fleayi]|uniref:retroelement silencing factor 1 n=1 Tax=Mixophyes fleayi TaxID=3061075 RepID=UPI003F4D9826